MSASRTQAFVWAILVGVLAFAAVELLVAGGLLQPPRLYYAWGGVVLAPILVFVFAQGIAFGGGALAGRVHEPRAGVAPPVRQYSEAQALAARGQFKRAVQLYEEGVQQYPDEFEPYLRIARIYRDHLEHLELAVRWYERARNDLALSEAQEFMICNEVAEIFRNRLNSPRRELEELERFVTKFPQHPSRGTVEKELRRLRADVRPPRA